MGTIVQLFKNNVNLSVFVNNDLTGNGGNFGFIEIHSGYFKDEPEFWDNIGWYLSCGKKEFKKECKKSLEDKGYNWKETYKDMKELLNRAVELKILVRDRIED